MHKFVFDISLLDNLPVAIGIADFDGNIVYLNNEFSSMYGYTVEDVPTIEIWANTVYPDSEYRKLAMNSWAEDIERKQQLHKDIPPSKFNILCKDNKVRTTEISFNIKDNFILSFFRDISEIEEKNEEVSLEKRFTEKIINCLPGNFFLFRKDGDDFKLSRWNKNFFRALQYHNDELKDMSPSDFIIEDQHEEISEFIGKIFHNGYAESELTLRTKNGKIEHHFIAASPFYDKDNTYILGSGYDISKQKLIEEDLRISKLKAEEADRLKSAFLANMSHEIRTPLNGILGFSGLLDNDSLSPDDRSYYIDIINQSSNQLLTIVDDILSLSKLETGQMVVENEELYVNGLLDELCTKYAEKASAKNIALSTNNGLDDKKSIIFSDKEKLQQILDNLLSNAIKFTHKGHVLMGYQLVDNWLEFYVEDTGIGINPEHHDKIFDRFQQVDIESTRIYGGTGLGLTIAKGNCELLGGKIWLDSEQNEGSKFIFSIPYNPVYTQEISVENDVNDKEKMVKSQTILIAEDEEINYLYLEELLREFDYEIIRAHDGEEAVELCKTNSKISLVLMDIKMPNMDGYTALKEINNIRPELPVIAQTAYAMLSDKEKALESGFQDYLSKPIKSSDLIETIKKYMH